MATMAENVIAAENGEILKDSVENGPYKLKSEITIKDTDGVTDICRAQRLEYLARDDKLRYDSEIKVVNILLLGFPVGIYTLINHYQTAKDIWDRVKELMEGTKMSKQESEFMLYAEFDKFTSEPGESIHSYYLRFAKLINDMNMIPMSMTLMQINTKFVNHLQPEWISLEETDDCKDLQLQATTNFKVDHIDAYDSDFDDEDTTNTIFMANLSPVGSLNDITIAPRYDSDTLSKLGYIENIVSNNELKGNSDVISYTNYMLIIGNDEDNYVPPPVQKNDMMLFVIEQMKSQVEKCNMVNKESKSVNESLTSEL
ncbi:hypothetical protein Tco_0179530 [Tanacetum coccineum]